MTEPLRWLHDERVPPALRGMLAASSGDIAFPDEVRLRVAQRIAATTATSLAVLGAAGLANAASGSASAAAGAGAGAAGATTLGAGVTATAGVKLTAGIASLALGAAVATTAVVQHERERIVSIAVPVAAPLVEQVAAHEEARVARRERVAPSSTLALRPIGELPVTVEELPLVAPSVEPRSARRDASDDVAHEVAELRELRSLAKRSPSEALSRLRAMDGGQFAAERRLLEVQALLSLGRQSEATTVGEAMLADPSASWYHERVRSLLGKSSVPPKGPGRPGHSLPGPNVKEGER